MGAAPNIPRMMNELRGRVLSGDRARAGQALALTYILESLTNYGKQHGPWRDRTGLLRRSYGGEVVESRAGKGMIGYWYNSAPYAIFVEYRPSYWVLSGAIREELPRLREKMKELLGVTGIRAVASTGKVDRQRAGLGVRRR